MTYTGSSAPAITLDPESQTISVNHPVTFTVAASGAPTLTYQWQKNDVDIGGATGTSYTINSVTLADDQKQFRCKVSNGSGTATSAEAVLTVTTNQPPTATISTPPPPTNYDAGDTITYAGSGSDPEDGALPPSALTWWVNFHHDTHFHPFMPADQRHHGRQLRDPDGRRDLAQRLVPHPSAGRRLERQLHGRGIRASTSGTRRTSSTSSTGS